MASNLTTTDFELRPRDAAWPLVFSLAVLIASLGAVVVTILGVEVPVWFTNVWLWIPVLVVTSTALLAATERSSRMLRRRMRHALVISLLAHLILAIFLKDQFLAFVAAPKELDEPVETEPLPQLPQYYFRPPERTSQSEVFEQPVQASVPQRVPTLARLEPDVDVVVDRAPSPRPLPNTTSVPAPLPFERVDLAVPRRADQASELSRQEAPSPEIASSTAQRAHFARRDAQPTPSLEATPANVTRTRAQRTSARRRLPTARLRLATPADRKSQRLSREPAPLRQSLPESLARRSIDAPQSLDLSPLEPLAPTTKVRSDRQPALLEAQPQTLARADVPARAPNRRRQSDQAQPSSVRQARSITSPMQTQTSSHESVRSATDGARTADTLADTRATRRLSRTNRRAHVAGSISAASASSSSSTTASSRGPSPVNGLEASATQLARSSTNSRRHGGRPDRSNGSGSNQIEAPSSQLPASTFSRAVQTGNEAITGLEGLRLASSGQPGTGSRGFAEARLSGGARAEALPQDGAGDGESLSRQGDGLSSASPALAQLSPGGDGGELQRATLASPVRNRASRGPGGLGARPTPVAGVASRRANPQSSLVHNTPSRFLQRRSVAPATLGSRSRTTAEPFARRSLRRTQQASNDPRRPSAATDAAIELGLQYLASVQRKDGRWSLQHTSADPDKGDRPAMIVADSAATGLALLAFLGAGYDHFGDQYAQNVAGGLNFLIRNQARNGDLYLKQPSSASNGVWFYSHGIAAMALGEAYGMTGDAALKRPAQAALDFIVASQSPQRGGWRYQPRVSSDLSVSGWQIMALKSGQLAGLRVPPEVLQKARRLLDNTQSDSRGSTFVYNPWATQSAESRNDRAPSTVMTAVGLLMRLYSGWTRESPAIREGAELLRQRLAASRAPYAFAGLGNPNRDTYYWYNATQVMFHMQGDHWKQWNERLYPMLAETQVTKGALTGSWHPTEPIPDRWGVYAGRVYVTALNLLSLEVYYRHLPLFDEGLAVK